MKTIKYSRTGSLWFWIATIYLFNSICAFFLWYGVAYPDRFSQLQPFGDPFLYKWFLAMFFVSGNALILFFFDETTCYYKMCVSEYEKRIKE
mgnify:CR=1 FL=1